MRSFIIAIRSLRAYSSVVQLKKTTKEAKKKFLSDAIDKDYCPNSFLYRHIGPRPSDQVKMLQRMGLSSLEELVAKVIPSSYTQGRKEAASMVEEGEGEEKPSLGMDGISEVSITEFLRYQSSLRGTATPLLGLGYYGTHTPAPILRHLLEHPDWYTAYTPYQPEISQGRLESLMNFQLMIKDLTGLPLSNASLLDEATAAAEAMVMAYRAVEKAGGAESRRQCWVDAQSHPQTLAVLASRAEGLGIELVFGTIQSAGSEEKASITFSPPLGPLIFGVFLQYPNTIGHIYDDLACLSAKAHDLGAHCILATDLLFCTHFKPPGELGADLVVGSSQRFGVPLGYGGPHAAFLACQEGLVRRLPGRLVGLSVDSAGRPAYRLTLQTREQHIRREHATSNICTAQALPAHMAVAYAMYHGPEGLGRIARRTHHLTRYLATALERLGFPVLTRVFFDSIVFSVPPLAPMMMTSSEQQQQPSEAWQQRLQSEAQLLLRPIDAHSLFLSLDETIRVEQVSALLKALAIGVPNATLEAFLRPLEQAREADMSDLISGSDKSPELLKALVRTSPFLTASIFESCHSETELMRYLYGLSRRDVTLTHHMIPLGSCTMKLNAATELSPLSWPAFQNLHPFVPETEAHGLRALLSDFEALLCQLTGMDAASLMPNSGAQGELAGLKVIRAYLTSIRRESEGERVRDVCLIPVSAHGTNPASAALAGLTVVPLNSSRLGSVCMIDFKAKLGLYRERLAALLITVPSTFGLFEPELKHIIEAVHEAGAQVYMDGANMNALLGLVQPGLDLGVDAMHINLHKTLCVPHGGGGPGMGPILVRKHLSPFLPGHPALPRTSPSSILAVSAAPFGSPLVCIASWVYLRLMGQKGLKLASQVALLNANYLKWRLSGHYTILYAEAPVAHEFILDVREFSERAGISALDIAKRLQDYGFHAPTLSWPIANTLMVEPTESESLLELERFAEALIAIRAEIEAVLDGRAAPHDHVLKWAPHTLRDLSVELWQRPYSRAVAGWPLPWVAERKVWPTVNRLDDAYGDSHLVCACPPPIREE